MKFPLKPKEVCSHIMRTSSRLSPHTRLNKLPWGPKQKRRPSSVDFDHDELALRIIELLTDEQVSANLKELLFPNVLAEK